MKADGEWERFTCSGSVSDYLIFKDQETREKAGDKMGDTLYAGFCSGNGHGVKDDTCR